MQANQVVQEKLLDGWAPEPMEEPKPKNGVKRQSTEPESPEPKRQKRAAKPKQLKKEESDLSDIDEEDVKPETSKTADRKIKAGDSEEEKPPIKTSPSPERKRKSKVTSGSKQDNKKLKEENKEEEKTIKVKRAHSSEDDRRVKKQDASDTEDDEDTKDSIKVERSKPSVDEEEEYSDVIDEPLPKRKKRASAETSLKPAKSAAKPSATKTASSPDDPDEVEIKKLQSQLIKCGVRKLWHNELKRYGGDTRAKIRHLKKMLADIGMEGRFSEAKAREIREARELLAEAEAAKEMDALWGMSSSGRASRSKSKTMKVDDSDSAGAGDAAAADGSDEDEEDTFAARRKRAQADLAFLGDDDSDDDTE